MVKMVKIAVNKSVPCGAVDGDAAVCCCCCCYAPWPPSVRERERRMLHASSAVTCHADMLRGHPIRWFDDNKCFTIY